MTDDQFEKLAQLIKGVYDDLSEEIGTQVGGLRTEMNERFAQVDIRFDQMDARFDKIENEIAHIYAELRDIRNRLEILEEQTKSNTGFSKEIDYAFTRITAIEQRLGLTPVAA